MLNNNELQFCFRIIEPADKPDSEPLETYCSMKFKNVKKNKLSELEYADRHHKLLSTLLENIEYPWSSIQLISQSEYMAATDGEKEIEHT
ncbi:hypothetical protein ACVWZB_004839 [Paenibacillus polymyxa]